MPVSDLKLREYLEHGWLKITPTPEDRHIQPASIDLHLGPLFLVPKLDDLSKGMDLGAGVSVENAYDHVDIRDPRWGNRYVLHPNEFILGATSERVEFANNLCGNFTGRSTLGRVGLLVHVTAGFCDPGFKGCITLEIKNVAPYPIILREGVGIGQIIVDVIDGYVQRPYGSSLVGSAYSGPNEGPVAPNLARKL